MPHRAHLFSLRIAHALREALQEAPYGMAGARRDLLAFEFQPLKALAHSGFKPDERITFTFSSLAEAIARLQADDPDRHSNHANDSSITFSSSRGETTA